MVMTSVISVRNLSKDFKVYRKGKGLLDSAKNLIRRDYKIIHAVKKISFDVLEGEIFGCIGPNGAGKSTTIKMMTGILVPSSGEVKVLGRVPWKQRKENALDIGVVFGQRTQLWWDLPAIESFKLLKSMYRVPNRVYNRNLRKFSKVLELKKFLDTPVRKLSLGQRMRCEIAAALLHDPKIVYLDEPTVGVDIIAKERIRDFIREINQEKKTTVILTTHDLNDIENLCKRMIIIDKGIKMYDGEIEAIKKNFATRRLLIVEFEEHINAKKYRGPGVVVEETGENKICFKVNPRKRKISSLIEEIMKNEKVIDISIEESKIEDIIKKIYREGMK